MGALGVALHSDAKRAFAGCMDGVYMLDIVSGESQLLYSHGSYVSNIVHLPDTELIISAGYDGALRWFDLASKKVVRVLQAHSFWSWDLARSAEANVLATSSGQYLAGDYEYRPLASPDPCVRVFDADTGDVLSDYEFGPPVQAVALSRDGKRVAAANLMGDVGVWEVGGEQLASWNTPDFTAFGIIKSHCQIGGIYAITFAPNENEVIVAGMGPMRDPMAGNGKQRWQRFDWTKETPEKVAQSDDDQVGEGLMETLAIHPSEKYFVMGGRLRGGTWSTALFDLASGDLIHSLKTDTRVTKAVFSADGAQLFLAGARKQKEDALKSFGVLDVFSVIEQGNSTSAADDQ